MNFDEDRDGFFEAVVEPSIQRLALFGVAHDVSFDGRNFVVSHKISRNVLTEFDASLSIYLSALTGNGMPGATVESRIKDLETDRSWAPYPARHAASVVDALAIAAKLALGDEQSMPVRFGPWHGEDRGADQLCELSQDLIAKLDEALWICRQIGTPDFLDLSGDFDQIMVRPRDAGMDMLTLDIFHGRITVPSVGDSKVPPYQGPLFNFARQMKEESQVALYMARAGHAVAAAKEEAVRHFRLNAEERIIQFSDALDGRMLDGYLMESAGTLVARLKAGLGDSLLGLSEEAQVRALDWATLVGGTGAPQIESQEQNTNALPDKSKDGPRLVS
jgi:hypothetical protein